MIVCVTVTIRGLVRRSAPVAPRRERPRNYKRTITMEEPPEPNDPDKSGDDISATATWLGKRYSTHGGRVVAAREGVLYRPRYVPRPVSKASKASQETISMDLDPQCHLV